MAITPLMLSNSSTVAVVVSAGERRCSAPIAKNSSNEAAVNAMNSTRVRMLLQRW
ncbi:hypothetical protein RLIN73S_03192 [Rhodanobacter lindaniclasticus]